MERRKALTFRKTVRPQTPEEQQQFEAAIDRLIIELVESELGRRQRVKPPSRPATETSDARDTPNF